MFRYERRATISVNCRKFFTGYAVACEGEESSPTCCCSSGVSNPVIDRNSHPDFKSPERPARQLQPSKAGCRFIHLFESHQVI